MPKLSTLVVLLLSVATLSLGLVTSRVLAEPDIVVLIPKISFPETEFNLGVVDEGIQVKHTFLIENKGQKTLLIKTAFSTCGCTIPKIKQKEIPPGQSGELEVLMDTSMKQGDVTKPIEIHTNDPVNPVSTIYIKAQVKSPHGELGTDRTAKIFTGRCAACHITKGIGKTGEELFAADCAMCHGFRAKGIPSVGPPLIPFDYHDDVLTSARKEVISHGSKVHRSMPGYAKDSGGPLSEKDIDSLVDYLRSKSDLDTKQKS